MTDSAAPSSPVASPKVKNLSARLSAVQAVYQMSQNLQPVGAVYEEYIHHRAGMEVDGEALVPPDGVLLKRILFGVEERLADLEPILAANVRRAESGRPLEPLLRAILLCGIYELMLRETEAPIIINDYLNVAHTFYGPGEVALINGALDAVSAFFKQ